MPESTWPKPGIVTIRTDAEAEVPASHAFLNVHLQSEQGYGGKAPAKQTKEVAALIAALKQAGVEEGDVSILGIHMSVTQGLLSKSSQARYDLKIKIAELDQLPPALITISSAKNATLDKVDWQFATERDVKRELLAKCVADAYAKATLVVTGLQQRIIGVEQFDESGQNHGPPPPMMARPAPAPSAPGFAASRASEPEPAMDLVVAHSRRIVVNVAVQFRVEPTGPNPAP